MRLIDADKLMSNIIDTFQCCPLIEVGRKSEYIKDIVDSQPTVSIDIESAYYQLKELQQIVNFYSTHWDNTSSVKYWIKKIDDKIEELNNNFRYE